MINVLKRIFTSDLEVELRRLLEEKRTLLTEKEVLQRQLSVAETAWEMICSASHKKDDRYRKALEEKAAFKDRCRALEYENNVLRARLSHIQASDLFDIPTIITSDFTAQDRG